MSTLAEIRTQVRDKAKLSAIDTTLNTLIDAEINRAIYALARMGKIPELLKIGGVVDLTAAVAGAPLPYDLADDFLEIVRFTYSSDDFGKAWDLYPRSSPVPPAPVYGRPNYYEICQGSDSNKSGLSFGPLIEIDLVGDSLTYDYYSIPDPLTDDSDPLPTIHWDEEIVRRVCAAINIRDNHLDQANALAGTSAPQSK